MKVAYQGQPGAFGHEACLRFAPGHEPIATDSFGDVVAAVAAQEAELGVLPLRNSCAGPVPGMEDLLASSGLPVLSIHELPVRMHLLGRPGTRLEQVRRVVSHPVALAQCAATLNALELSTEAAANTAVAAKALASGGDPETAVLASETAATLYGLVILRRDMHDQPDNRTTFCVLGRQVP